MVGVFFAANDEVRFDFLQAEFIFEVVEDKLSVEAVFAGVEVGANEAATGKGVNADVAFLNNDKAAPAARIFDVIALRKVDFGIA